VAKWFVTTKKADFEEIARRFKITPVLARIIRNRDIIEEREIDMFLNGTLQDLHSPYLLKDVERGCNVLLDAIKKGEKIRIIGDYDIDGICSTFILKRVLTLLKADVDTAIPHRIKDGYGLNENLIDEAKEEGASVILTCDNGISAYSQIAYANECGMKVVVTDHHEVPFTQENGMRKEILPPAAAVIDPKREDCEYPFSGICGAVVAYKFADVLLQKAMEQNSCVLLEDRLTYLDDMLEFAAIATIGDVMALVNENHIIVKYGLKKMAESKNVGLKALLAVNDLDGKELSQFHIGFVLGPCINATGRLDTAKRALELFESENEREAVLLATELKELNESRKELTNQETERAIEMLERHPLPKIIVLYLSGCHESIAGIIAGRIKERYHRPTIVITPSEDGVKGSGRSIEAYSMYEALHEVEDLFTKYGGHPMAAGLSMSEESKVAELKKRLNDKAKLTEDDFEEKVRIDVPMPISYLSMDFVQELSRLEPYGNGNPKPLFAQKNVRLTNGRVLGKNRNVAKFQCDDGEGHFFEAVYFGEADEMICHVEAHQGICNIVYYPDINEYRGIRTIQVVVKYYDFSC